MFKRTNENYCIFFFFFFCNLDKNVEKTVYRFFKTLLYGILFVSSCACL